ncbi:Photosystem Q(B) protein [Acorus calamus]|uniref:Photosystem Q(B) protein n=1 Tax=Acorus calamus TaxID=4465 RepID=A0AAV9F0R2_ACOCL|nr:Photosystem Q(B) protein [Acorus calamus]
MDPDVSFDRGKCSGLQMKAAKGIECVNGRRRVEAEGGAGRVGKSASEKIRRQPLTSAEIREGGEAVRRIARSKSTSGQNAVFEASAWKQRSWREWWAGGNKANKETRWGGGDGIEDDSVDRYSVQGRVINTWADIINRANLGMEVMHERNAHNFPLDLASVEAPSTNG